MALNQAIEIAQGILPHEFESWDEVPQSLLPTPTAVDSNTVAQSELDANNPKHRLKVAAQVLARDGLLPTPNTMEHLPAREGEARERQLRRGGDESRRTVSGNLREDILNLLPTPNTMDMLPARTPEQKAANKGKGGYSNVRETVVNELLQTTTASDWKGANHSGSGSASTNGISTAVELLQTPVASEGLKAPAQQNSETKKQTGQVWLSNQAKDMETNWGKFEPAIRRWEAIIGRAAPAPTKPDGKDGAHRLSSEFTEWMMGLPAGWITDCGLTRNEELKACGNGVVPQQAALALRMLLDRIKTAGPNNRPG